MNTQARDTLRAITDFASLVDYLRDELDWPIEETDFEDLTFDYGPEELGIDEKNAAKIDPPIKQLRPLASNQPWGIFFVKFEPKLLPVVALRRILSRLVLKKRSRAEYAEQASWQLHDLLFILNFGETEQRQITFAHFSENPGTGDLPTLQVLGWDAGDTALHIDHVDAELHSKMRWPDNETDLESWRERWSAAFTLRHREVITTSKKLAVELAQIAQRIRRRVNAVLEIEDENGAVRKLMTSFKEALIHDLSEDDFADMYAQTISYGLLSARVSRPAGLVADDLAHMTPVTNPFLKELLETFLNISGRRKFLDFDELGVNEVVQLLREANMDAVLRDFGDANPREDPVIHFYELFLKEYDAKKRMQRGVFYTPRPVVSFIVRSVDEILRTEFDLPDGLADTATWGEMARRHKDLQIPKGADPGQCFVQILDPATGTGTFLVEVIGLIHKTLTAKWQKQGKTAAEMQQLWNDYVPKYLLSRLHGYELLMAPYAIAHMKIGLKLAETGYRFGSEERVRVYLTNALEPAQDFSDRLAFAVPALAHEAEAVNAIKRNQRFTVVIGNPPYANFGRQNRIPFILGLLEDYKRGLNERKINLDDDFIKFVRIAQWIIEQTGVGILGFITNNTYLDGITHRRMRDSILTAFGEAFFLNLHGSLVKNEQTPDGSQDQNVFDIQQGVAINLLIRQTSKGGSQIHYADLWGSRNTKYEHLFTNDRVKTPWQVLRVKPPYTFFVPKDFSRMEEYKNFVSLRQVMSVGTSAVQTKRDNLFVDFEKAVLADRMREIILSGPTTQMIQKYSLEPSSGWTPDCLKNAKFTNTAIREYLYRPFDSRFIYYDDDLLGRSRITVFKHLLKHNLALATLRQTVDDGFRHVFCSRSICDINLTIGHHVSDQVFPLYLYSDTELLGFSKKREGNYSPTFVRQITSALNVEWVEDGHEVDKMEESVNPKDVFFYSYAVFYSPAYRLRYLEFLKIDFPRLPLTSSLELFRALAQLGGELVALHLMESPRLDNFITTLVAPQPCEGLEPLQGFEFRVEKVSYSDETVWLDKAQTYGFRGVPEEVWNFHIGGYQVCEKWLKDRQARGGKNPRPGRVLTPEDLAHYQKIVVALKETIRLMQEIDEVIEEHGGWPGAFVTK